MTGVLIVDDHASMREALARSLTDSGEFYIAGSADRADLAFSCCETLHPELVFLDVCTEGWTSGLTAVERLREQWPELKLLVMSGFDEISFLPRAQQAGANGFLHKSSSLTEFLQAARQVIAGETYFPEPQKFSLPLEETLSTREMEVLRLICRHLTTKEIAQELFISENTVKFHKANLLAKTGFPTVLDLAFYMISGGWINPRY